MVSHEALLVAVQPQPVAVVTEIDALDAVTGLVVVTGDRPNAHELTKMNIPTPGRPSPPRPPLPFAAVASGEFPRPPPPPPPPPNEPVTPLKDMPPPPPPPPPSETTPPCAARPLLLP